MAVGSKQSLARNAETFHMKHMAHAIAWVAKPDAELLAGASQEYVIVRILIIFLQEIVIDILNRDLGSHSWDTNRLEFQQGQRTRCVLSQSLVDFNDALSELGHAEKFPAKSRPMIPGT